MIETTSQVLAESGHEVVIFAPGYRSSHQARPGGESGAEDADVIRLAADPWARPGIEIVRFPSVPAPTYPGFVLPIPWRRGLTRLVTRLRLDVVHSHSPFLMGGVALRLAKHLGLPLVFTHHTMYHEYVHYAPLAQGLARQWVWQHVANYCAQVDTVIAVSEAVERLVYKGYGITTPVELIPSGVDLRLYRSPERDRDWLRRTYGIPANAPVLINVGRLTLEKNPGLLLRSLQQLRVSRDADPRLAGTTFDPWLVLVGDGPQAAEVRRQATELGVASRVILTGRLEPARVADALLGADIFVMASFTETQGLVVAEALACGLPTVVVDSPPLRESVQDGQAGLIVAGEPDALAAACRHLLTDPSLRQRLQSAALRRGEELSVQAATAKLLALYRRLISARQRTEKRGGG
ncbi:MAG: glycosyltransferase [Limnochordaceae bacterium]|nr:glycosyltransferase [Limnochordaceae bacterium]